MILFAACWFAVGRRLIGQNACLRHWHQQGSLFNRWASLSYPSLKSSSWEYLLQAMAYHQSIEPTRYRIYSANWSRGFAYHINNTSPVHEYWTIPNSTLDYRSVKLPMCFSSGPKRSRLKKVEQPKQPKQPRLRKVEQPRQPKLPQEHTRRPGDRKSGNQRDMPHGSTLKKLKKEKALK